jgi:hypothetical protein
MLKQAEERILGTDNAARAIEIALFTRETSNDWGMNSASRKPFQRARTGRRATPGTGSLVETPLEATKSAGIAVARPTSRRAALTG